MNTIEFDNSLLLFSFKSPSTPIEPRVSSPCNFNQELHCPVTLLGSLLGLLLLIRGLGWLENTSLCLQDKVWAIRITSMGLSCLPSWTTVFLWSQMVHNVVKMDCIYSKDPSSFQLRALIRLINHCYTNTSLKSEV